MQFLILANIGDETALRVCSLLRQRHNHEEVKLVSCEELVLAPYWSHCLDFPDVVTQVRLHDGISLTPDDMGVIYNRLRYVVMPHYHYAKRYDSDYAVMEMYAILLSWLSSLPCPVVNRPDERGLAAQDRSLMEWLTLAGRAGLPVRGFFFTTDARRYHKQTFVAHRSSSDHDIANSEEGLVQIPAPLIGSRPAVYLEPTLPARQHVLVAGDCVVGALGSTYSEALQRLRTSIGCDLLQVTFGPSDETQPRGREGGTWKVCDVSTFPQCQDRQSIQAIVHLLESRLTESRLALAGRQT